MSTDESDNIVLMRVDRLEPGMEVARSIHSEGGCRLLSEGDELTYDDIERLKRWKKRSIYIVAPEEEEAPDDENGGGYRQAS